MADLVDLDQLPTPDEIKGEIKKIIQGMKKENPELTKEELAEHERVLTDVILNLRTPAAAMGFSPQFIESLYTVAYQAFKGGDYKTALPLFKMLAQLDSDKPRYFAGMASVYYAKKEWDKAQQFFIAASFVDPNDPLPYYYAAECALQKKDLLEALFFYRGVVTRGEGVPQYAALVERMRLSIKKLEEMLPMETRSVNVPGE